MIIWNTSSIQLLQTCIDNFVNNPNSPSFIILSWPQSIGKSTIAIDMLQSRLDKFFYNDLLHIQDLTEIIGKKHSLKIQLPTDKDDRYIDLWDDRRYEDMWIREINRWLQQSPAGKFKVVLIENLERIVPAAANAFLKTCEEPLPWRLIIATTSHQSQLLDTIISRALTIRFTELNQELITQFIKDKWFWSEDIQFQKFAISMAMGRPGVLVRLNDRLSRDEELQNNFFQLIDILTRPGSIVKKQEILNKLDQNWTLDNFLDWWIAYCLDHGLSEQSHKRLEIKKMFQSNVKKENLLLYGVI